MHRSWLMTPLFSFCLHALQADSDHEWDIRKGFTKSTGKCANSYTIGVQYNPYDLSTSKESGYPKDCTSYRHQRCVMGDLTKKLGAITLSATRNKTYSFYDENLSLAGPYNSELKLIVYSEPFTNLQWSRATSHD